MFEFVIISKDGRQIFSHKEPTYETMVKWGLACDIDVPPDADHYQIRAPDGHLIEIRRMNGMRKL